MVVSYSTALQYFSANVRDLSIESEGIILEPKSGEKSRSIKSGAII